MMTEISRQLADRMERLGIDVELTEKILNNFNAGRYDRFEPVRVKDVPEVDGQHIIDMQEKTEITLDLNKAEKNMKKLDPHIDIKEAGHVGKSTITFDQTGLERIGIKLYPLLSYGVLNGGSASSYVDRKKNIGFNKRLFSICEKEFGSIRSVSNGRAKGLTPAYINKDGSHGASFMELKMRAVLIESLKFRICTDSDVKALYPMFQMTSVYNNDEVLNAYKDFKNSGLLRDLIKETGIDITDFKTGVQPMLAAFTHSEAGKRKSVFLNACGEEGRPLAMPGGHGQNFIVLKDIYRELYAEGKRFIYLGNVDNLGFTVNPSALALLALKGSRAGFDFAFRTPVDVKGGVLVIDQNGKLNCADIGAAISKEELIEMEKRGKKILFNCATGLFNLEYLVENIDSIIENLPMRISDQDKDAGKYSQAEQITWEIIGIMDDILIFGINKYKRFLAAKLLIEGLMTSGVGLDRPDFPTDENPEKDLKLVAQNLHNGLINLLGTTYGMKLLNDRWVPKPVEELKSEIIGKLSVAKR